MLHGVGRRDSSAARISGCRPSDGRQKAAKANGTAIGGQTSVRLPSTAASARVGDLVPVPSEQDAQSRPCARCVRTARRPKRSPMEIRKRPPCRMQTSRQGAGARREAGMKGTPGLFSQNSMTRGPSRRTLPRLLRRTRRAGSSSLYSAKLGVTDPTSPVSWRLSRSVRDTTVATPPRSSIH